MSTLQIRDLHAETQDGKKILNGLSLTVSSGEIHAIMGPNGSGKSTLCKVLLGHPKYKITQGKALLDGQDITELDTNERANLGLFLGFQNPEEIPGVTLGNFLRHAKNSTLKEKIGPVDFMKTMREKTDRLNMDNQYIGRAVNHGFSGGEKKRAEILQMSVLEPKIALLDEIDSGLDIDALKQVAKGINQEFKRNKLGLLLITHYQRLLNFIEPQFVHIMIDGKILKSGGKELAIELEEQGYDKYQ